MDWERVKSSCWQQKVLESILWWLLSINLIVSSLEMEQCPMWLLQDIIILELWRAKPTEQNHISTCMLLWVYASRGSNTQKICLEDVQTLPQSNDCLFRVGYYLNLKDIELIFTSIFKWTSLLFLFGIRTHFLCQPHCDIEIEIADIEIERLKLLWNCHHKL